MRPILSALGLALTACSTPSPDGVAGEVAPAAPQAAEAPAFDAGVPALLVWESTFEMVQGKPVPQPAKLTRLRRAGDAWRPEVLTDPASNVFHKVVPWRGGLLTIGAEKARLVHWTEGAGGWSSTVLWQRSWGGKFDRLRDLEIGDVDGDGADELVIATHDQGVIAIGHEQPDGWAFVELGQRADVFVHEIELGDVDGDGRAEIYATPSARNRSSGASQSGEVVQWRHDPEAGPPTEPTGWVGTTVASWPDTHAKEILVTELGGRPRLLAVREGVVDDAGGLVSPVTVVQLDASPNGFVPQELTTLPGERQSRFLTAGDIDGDGTTELVITGMNTGLWRLEPGAEGWERAPIDGATRGFEQAVHLADLDGDGTPSILVADEPAGGRRTLRRYRWDGSGYRRESLYTFEGAGLVWGIGHADP